MADLILDAWPPARIRTERLLLREPEERDRTAAIDLMTSPVVFAHLGGPRERDELERTVGERPRRWPGRFLIDLDGALIGMVTITRRDPERPGHLRPEGFEAELSYLLLPEAWGRGYATEACRAVLDWAADALPNEPVVLCTQSANQRSVRLAERLGFVELERFQQFGAEQWFGVRRPAPISHAER